jgi:D-alanine-D-alanine ligase
MTDPLHITVLRGGPSAEREVSLRSGAAVAGALRSLGHRVDEVDPIPGDLRIPAGTRAVFLALHGTYGEDGTVQSELEELGLPYTGCGVRASLYAFDKILTKRRCLKAGVPTARFERFIDTASPWPGGWEPPVVLKPVRQGSSVGLRFVDRVSDFPQALAESLGHGGEVLMEERILGRETTVGILDGSPLPVVEVRPRAGSYDYANKYTPGRTEYFCPADFDPSVTRAIQGAAMSAFEAIGGRDYARVDVMVRPDGSPVVLEVNTLPGMTETSLLPKAAAASGIPFPQLCERMLRLALARASRPG